MWSCAVLRLFIRFLFSNTATLTSYNRTRKTSPPPRRLYICRSSRPVPFSGLGRSEASGAVRPGSRVQPHLTSNESLAVTDHTIEPKQLLKRLLDVWSRPTPGPTRVGTVREQRGEVIEHATTRRYEWTWSACRAVQMTRAGGCGSFSVIACRRGDRCKRDESVRPNPVIPTDVLFSRPEQNCPDGVGVGLQLGDPVRFVELFHVA